MANLTRAGVEAQLARRVGGLLTRVGLDGATRDGTNADLNDPIRRAVRALGLGVSDPVEVADVDVAGVTGWVVEKLIDLAEFRTLENVWGNWAEYRQVISKADDDPQQLADRIEARIALLENRLRKPYGQNVGVIASGSVRPGRHTPNDRVLSPQNGYGAGFPDGFSAAYGGGDFAW